MGPKIGGGQTQKKPKGSPIAIKENYDKMEKQSKGPAFGLGVNFEPLP